MYNKYSNFKFLNFSKNSGLKNAVSADLKGVIAGTLSTDTTRNNPFGFPAVQTSVNQQIGKAVTAASTIIKPNQQ